MALPSYKSANKADLSFYYWARPKILDSTASLGGSSWVSTQRQTALSPIPPSDYKLPSGEQAVRTEPSRMGGDKIKGKKKTPVMSPFLPLCVQHLRGFSLRAVEAKNNLRSLCRITTQYFITHNLNNS